MRSRLAHCLLLNDPFPKSDMRHVPIVPALGGQKLEVGLGLAKGWLSLQDELKANLVLLSVGLDQVCFLCHPKG